MIRSVGLLNFKCFRRASVALGDLTVLTGLNGMGKSSAIQALLMVTQSLADSSNKRRLLTKGKYIDLGTASDVLHDSASTNSIGIRISGGASRATFKLRARAAKENTYTYNNTHSALRLETFSDALCTPYSYNGISKFQYLQAERSGPRKYLPVGDEQSRNFEIGSQGEYVLHLLDIHGSTALESEDPRVISGDGLRLIDQAEAWLRLVSPGVSIQLKTLYEADLIQAGFSFSSPGALSSRVHRATNVGFGISYVLPVIVALLATPVGGLIIIENPEAHLHPQGQTYLGELCARAAKIGIQVIVETHSDHFMDGVRLSVKNSILSPLQVKFHYFHRSGTETHIKTPTIDDKGRLSEWPDGFNDQHRKNAVQLLKP
ncbi:AAA family ATPase [Pseudomonas fluorescens]|uniref:AAA family ATPase n=1 Tax=Pseudomonas fluorescens TaxID=294 RepID=UPI0020C58C0B|nr:DUF3696 domain-containing protein [Pseudomonas fluorescens]UTL92336.1 DUF3696 domain-containing protein [Pseudomonas fluorescens]